MSKIKDIVLKKYFKKYFKKNIEQVLTDPMESQQKLFEYLLEQGKKTIFGQRFHFSSIASIEDFQNQVPLFSYEDFFPYVEQILKGVENVSWPGKIKVFSKSAGTTNDRSKYIPVSEESLYEGHYRGGKDIFALYVDRFPETEIFAGKMLSITGSLEVDEKEKQVGDISALIANHLPWWAELSRVPGKDIALMTDWSKKLDAIIESCKDEDVRAIVGVPSWIYVILKTLLEKTGASRVRDVWPNFEVCFYGGMSIAPYQELLQKLEPDMRFSGVYNAADAFLGGQYTDGSGEILLSVDNGVFYEFVPIDTLNDVDPVAYTLGQVSVGVEYVIVLSTNGGLWRYILGDTVTFVSTVPPIVKITGRTKQFINICGEELMVANAEDAITRTQEITKTTIRDFTVAPVFVEEGVTKNSAHQWLIEFEVPPQSLEEFTEVLDQELCRQNSDYDAKRKNNTLLRQPQIVVLPPGSVYKWFESKGKLGGQNKLPRLSNTRKYVEEILALLKT